MKIESNQFFGDDTGANDVDLYCRNGGFISAEVNTDWGEWTSVLSCPEAQAVFGLMTRVESDPISGDDTALNGLKLACTEY